MKLIRVILRKMILFYDQVFSPRPIVRSPEDQMRIDQAVKKMALYQFEACPFCVKVRRAAKKLNLPLEYRDVLKNKTYETELLKGGGHMQVPCLRIEETPGDVKWMYESSDIVTYLRSRFP